MKILQVIHNFPPYNVGGSEVYTYNLSMELAKKYKVFVFHRINDPHKKEYEVVRSNINGLEIYAINNTFSLCDSYEMTYNNEIITKRFAEILDKTKPDIVHIQHLLSLSTTIVREIKSRGIPVVYTLHDYWLICPQAQLLRRSMAICNNHNYVDCVDCQIYYLSLRRNIKKLYQKCYRIIPGLASLCKKLYFNIAKKTLPSGVLEGKIKGRATHIKYMCDKVDIFIAPSRLLLTKFIESGMVSSAKALLLNYGFNKRLFNNREKMTLDGKVRFGFIGTLLPHKGVHIMIEAFNKIKDKRAELKIYGKSYPYAGFEYYPGYIKKIAQNRNIKFLGGFHNDNIADIFLNIDTLIVPSIWLENSPLVIQEAFLAGIPVIASEVGGIPELVNHGVNGLLFKPGDCNDLYDKMKLIIDSPDYIEKLIKNIPAVTSIEGNARELEKVYSGLLTQAN
ncbi:MAG: glycosyltransferase family 4 protein [Candidatus Omnitrophota bacterium]